MQKILGLGSIHQMGKSISSEKREKREGLSFVERARLETNSRSKITIVKRDR